MAEALAECWHHRIRTEWGFVDEDGPADPPVYLMVVPPFSSYWVKRMEQVGSVPVSDSLRSELAEGLARERAWELALEVSSEAKEAGCAGVIVTGIKFDTVVDEASRVWRDVEG